MTPAEDMGVLLDLRGKRFGRLLVLDKAPADARHRVCWHCICDCGTQRVVRSADLRYRKVRSCGCLRTEVATARGLAQRKHAPKPKQPEALQAAVDLEAAWPQRWPETTPP